MIAVSDVKSSDTRWRAVTLSDVVDILDSKRVPVNRTERAKRLGDVPYYGATGQVGWIDDFLFDEELVLLGEDGAPFLEPQKPKAYRIEGKSWVNNHAHVLRAKCGVDARFLVHALNTVDYRPFVSGTTRLKLTQAAMRRIPILLPSLWQQQQIVGAIETQFARLDDAVAALQRARTRLSRYRASVLKAACEGRLVPTEAELARQEGRSYEPTSMLLERVRAEREAAGGTKRGKAKAASLDTSDLHELPEGWAWTALGNIVSRSEYGTSTKCDYDFTGPPVLRIPNMIKGTLELGDMKYASSEQTVSEEDALREGDLLICRTNGSINLVGRSAIVRTRPVPDHGFASYLLRFRMVETSLMPSWVHTYLWSHQARLWIERHAASSAGQNNVSLALLGAMPLPIPPFAEQARILAEVERLMSVIEQMEATVETSLKRAEALRQSILRLAFSGRLVRDKALEKVME